jgi:hypothetical protein
MTRLNPINVVAVIQQAETGLAIKLAKIINCMTKKSTGSTNPCY